MHYKNITKSMLNQFKLTLSHSIGAGSKLLLALLCYLLFGGVTPSFAIDPQENTLEQTQPADLLAKIESETTLSDEEKASNKELVQQAKQYLDKTIDLKAQTAYYKNIQIKGPLEQAQLAEKLATYKTPELPVNLVNTSLSNLETLISKENIQLSEWRNRVTQISNEINEAKTIDLQQLLQQTKQKIRDTELNLTTYEQEGTVSLPKQIEQLVTTSMLDYFRAYVDMLEQQLLSRTIRLALLNTEQELVLKQIAGAELRQSELQNKISTHHYSESVRLFESTQAILDENLPFLSPEIATVAKQNNKLADELKQLIINHDQILNKIESVSKEATRFEKKYTGLTEQLKIIQIDSSPEFATALREQRDNLADLTVSQQQLEKYEQALTKSRLGQFKVDTERQTDIKQTSPEVQGTDNQGLTQDIIEMRERLLKMLSSSYSDHIDELNKLIAHIQTLHSQRHQYAQLLDQELLWMPSNSFLGFKDFLNAAKAVTSLTKNILSLKFVTHIRDQIKQFSFLSLLSIGLLIVFFIRAPKLIRHLSVMKQRIGNVSLDNFSITILALVITFTMSLPVPFIFYVSQGLIDSNDSVYHPLAIALTTSAGIFLFLEFIYQSLRKSGLTELHFKWSTQTQRLLKINLHWLKWASIPLIILTVYAEYSTSSIVRESLGRIAFIATVMTTTLFSYKAFNLRKGLFSTVHEHTAMTPALSMNVSVFILMVLLPLLLAILSLIGYHYTAFQLAIYFLQSIIIIILGIYLFFLARRFLAINQRRLALKRARKKREKVVNQNEGNADDLVTIEPEAASLQTISQQTETLLKMIMSIGIAIVLWGIWSELFSTFQRLDNVYLWKTMSIIDGSAISSGLTVWNALLAVVLSIITFLAARNIPGLLEVAFLSRWSLETGTNYAITTLSRYLIVITGTVIVLQLLGAQWSKLQWLVAALSVGLGFGLQEIVANFVSGIVILFERPIRIGDTVTIGEQFGTVSQIRIRATTVVDWDRREIIIPNKTFITERLVNWSLSDPIIRTTIKVGVAYGSDIALTEQCLLEIARKNIKILEDPAPVAWFREFGDSSLNFELRVFIKGIQDLNPVIHEVHIAIDNEFREHNIEIAFPQRDLHFDPKPLEIRIVNQDD